MLTGWSPWNEIASLHRDPDSLFGRFYSQTPQSQGAMTPAAAAVRDEGQWRISMALPGVAAEQIEVQILGSGRFARELTLPDEIDLEGVKASCRHGMLDLTLPIRESARARTIDVTTGEAKPLKAA